MKTEHVIQLSGIVLLAVALAGCKSAPVEAGTQTQSRSRVDAAEITVNGSLKERIKTGSPVWQSVAGTMNVAARVEADETRLARVSAPVTGRIVELNAYEGQHVNRG